MNVLTGMYNTTRQYSGKPTVNDYIKGGQLLANSLSNYLRQTEGDTVGKIYNVNETPDTAAPWLPTEHAVFAVLTKHFYKTPKTVYNGWQLVFKQPRIGVYSMKDMHIIVFRGTQDFEDVIDDLNVAGFSRKPVTLIDEGQTVIDKFRSSTKIILTGHSLGGYAAQMLAERNGLKSIVFNPAAPATNPPRIGPGKGKGIAYHVVGDLVSTHVDITKNDLLRVDFGYGYTNTLGAHAMNLFLAGGPSPIAYLTAQQEDEKFNMFTSVGAAFGSVYFTQLNVPIPGSLRDLDPKKGIVGQLSPEFNMNNFVDKVGMPVAKVLINTPTTASSNLNEFKNDYMKVLEMSSKAKAFKKENWDKIAKNTKLKMVNDIFGLISVTKLPEEALARNLVYLYSIYSQVTNDAPLALDSFAQDVKNPPIDLKKENNLEMLDIDPEIGSGTLIEMIQDASIPYSLRVEQLQAIARNYDNYKTFNREEILEKIRTDPQAPSWVPIPIFKGQTDVNIY